MKTIYAWYVLLSLPLLFATSYCYLLITRFSNASFSLFSFDRSMIYLILILAIILSLISVPLFLFAVIETPSSVILAISLIISLLGMPITAPHFEIYSILTGGFILANYFFVRRIRLELANQIRFKPSQILSRSIGSYLTIMAIAISVCSYISLKDQPQITRIDIPSTIIEKLIGFIEPNVNSTIQQAAPSVDEQFKDMEPLLIEQLKKGGITDADDQNKYLSDARRQLESTLKQNFSSVLSDEQNPNQALITEVETQVEKMLTDLINEYQGFIPIFYSVSVFALFSLLDKIMVIFGSVVSILVFKVLFYLNALHSTQETVIREKISI